MPQYDYLIVGAGFFGSVFARQMTDAGRRCLVIDRRDHIGGNCHTQRIGGIDVHRYGPHIFHTNSPRIWNYIRQFADFHPYRHRVKARCGNTFYSLPVNLLTLNQIWGVTTPQEAREKLDSVRLNIPEPANLEEWALAHVGREIYELLFRGYTMKQWGKDPRTLPASILKRLPIRLHFNDDYFDDAFQGIPIGGYTPVFEKLLQGIDLQLSTDFFADRRALQRSAAKVVYTGMMDRYFDYRHGQLEWRSLRFEFQNLPVDDFQGTAIVNYPDAAIPFTRITECKHFLPQTAATRGHTVITREYPQAWTPQAEPYYPINSAENEARLAEYRRMTPPDVIFGGRLGDYKYYDMHQAIGSALAKARAELMTQNRHRPAAQPGLNRRFACVGPNQPLEQEGDYSMDQQGQTHSPVPTAADRPATPDLAAGGNFRLVCPDGRQLAGNVILHSGGRIYTDMVPLQNRSWSPLATVPDAILCGGVTWARTENDFVTANLGALSAQRFRPQVIRQNRLAAAPWRSTARLTRQQPVPADRRDFEIVIARYREDTAWADCYPHNATIYCKDPNHQDPRFIPLPNTGREYGTYLHHIVSRYDSLAERTLFVQGDPFFHRLPPIEDFAFAKEDFMSLVNMHHSMAQAVNWGWPDQTVDGAVKTEFLRLLECPTDFHRFSFTWGAQFVVTRTLLQRRPKSYFQKLYAISQLPEITLCGQRFDNLHIGFMFEFFWENIFRGEAMPNPDAVPAGRRGVGALGEREITAGHLV